MQIPNTMKQKQPQSWIQLPSLSLNHPELLHSGAISYCYHPQRLHVESAEELAIRSSLQLPRPPHRPCIPVLDRAGGHDEWFIPPARKQLTHRCIPAPYFQSVQKLNGFTNSPVLSPAIAAVCCSICKIRKMSIEMHRYTMWEEAVLAESSLYAAVNSVQAAWPDRLLKRHLKSSDR